MPWFMLLKFEARLRPPTSRVDINAVSFEAALDLTDYMLCVDIGTNLVELQVGVVGVKVGTHRIEPCSSSSRMRTNAVV
ncbi:unnamed protein product [Alternaria alternata]